MYMYIYRFIVKRETNLLFFIVLLCSNLKFSK